jgi:hypothetical protein
MDGPQISISNKPTFNPFDERLNDNCAETVDFPTPPLPND